MSGFFNLLKNFLTSISTSVIKKYSVSPKSSTYLFINPDNPNNVPSLHFVLTGARLDGERYSKYYHRIDDDPIFRNTVKQRTTGFDVDYYYDPILLQQRLAQRWQQLSTKKAQPEQPQQEQTNLKQRLAQRLAQRWQQWSTKKAQPEQPQQEQPQQEQPQQEQPQQEQTNFLFSNPYNPKNVPSLHCVLTGTRLDEERHNQFYHSIDDDPIVRNTLTREVKTDLKVDYFYDPILLQNIFQQQPLAPNIKYLFSNPNDPNNVPSLNFVLTGTRLDGEIYREYYHVDNDNPIVRNTVKSIIRDKVRQDYFYNPILLQKIFRQRFAVSERSEAATEAYFAALKARQLRRGSDESDKYAETCSVECPVCYDFIKAEQCETLDVLICDKGHIFHYKCPLYKDSKILYMYKSCPICRSKIMYKLEKEDLDKSKLDESKGGGILKKIKQSRKPYNRTAKHSRKQRKH